MANLFAHLNDLHFLTVWQFKRPLSIRQFKGLCFLIVCVRSRQGRLMVWTDLAQFLLERLHMLVRGGLFMSKVSSHELLHLSGDILTSNLHFEDCMGDSEAFENWDRLGDALTGLEYQPASPASGEETQDRRVEDRQRLDFELLEHDLRGPSPRLIGRLTQGLAVRYEHWELLLFDAQNVAPGMLPETFQSVLLLAAHADTPSLHGPRDSSVAFEGLGQRFVPIVGLLFRCRSALRVAMFIFPRLVDRCASNSGGKNGSRGIFARKANLEESRSSV
mmetsp:Transcript_1735/g.3842  ORF Transcript_1735/g.3842 Transcript_1735/m.3842 type:complete len:276 (+) Transcript_1735:431-1258(+)